MAIPTTKAEVQAAIQALLKHKASGVWVRGNQLPGGPVSFKEYVAQVLDILEGMVLLSPDYPNGPPGSPPRYGVFLREQIDNIRKDKSTLVEVGGRLVRQALSERLRGTLYSESWLTLWYANPSWPLVAEVAWQVNTSLYGTMFYELEAVEHDRHSCAFVKGVEKPQRKAAYLRVDDTTSGLNMLTDGVVNKHDPKMLRMQMLRYMERAAVALP